MTADHARGLGVPTPRSTPLRASDRTPSDGGERDRWPVRVLLALYPPSWRARYGAEFAALLGDTGIRFRHIGDVLLSAVRAWLRPSRRLHDRPTRLRSTLSVTTYGVATLAASAVLFAKTTHDGAAYAHDAAGHPATAWLYDAFVACCVLSAACVAVGALPLVALSWRRARRARRPIRLPRELLTPAVAASGFLLAVLLVAKLTPPHGQRAWFLALAALGVLTAITCAAGPARLLRTTRLPEAALRFAARAGVAATALLGVASAAAVASELTRPGSPGNPAALTAYGLCTGITLLVTTASNRRALATPK
jgi:hypothetical protein